MTNGILHEGFMLYVRYNVDGCMTHIRKLHSNGKIPTYKDIEMYSIPIADYALDRYEEPIKILDDISSLDSYRSLSPEYKSWMNEVITNKINSEERKWLK